MRQVYQNSYISNYYSMGNVAVNVQPNQIQKKKEKQNVRQTQKIQSEPRPKNEVKMQVMDLPYVLFLTAAIVVSFILCVNYVAYNANLTSSVNQIKQLENKLFTLQEENRTEEAYIDAKVNLLEVKERAINDLGMVYPVKGQVYFYKQPNSDYVTQYADIVP